MPKKRSFGNKILTLIFNVLQLGACGFLVYSASLLSDIETKWVYLGIAVLILMNIAFIFFLRKLTKKPKVYKFIIFIALSLILTIAQAGLGYYVFRGYSSLNSINKSRVTYESNLVVMKNSNISKVDDLKGKNIGIVNDKTSIDGYILGLDIINDNKLNDIATVVEYESSSNLVADLYSGKIDAMIISNNYVSMFKSIESYTKIADETSVIAKKEKTYSKSEIAKHTGDEIINFNESNSVTEPFTVLIMGIDSTSETLEKNATGNGDALMLVTFNPKTFNATILSIPRDTYVPIACFANQKENKITHAAWNGESCMIKTIQNFTGINIDYYVKINFKGVVKLVDALGGITVNVPDGINFCEQNSDRLFGEYEQCISPGVQNLSGEQALALARHRKTLPTGDFQRGLNQQLVVQGMLNKLKSVTSANKALEILNALSNSMDTNFTTKQLLSFYDIVKNLFLTSSNSDNIINMQQLYLSGTSQMIYDESIGLVLYNFIPNQSSLKQITDEMKKNLGLLEAPATIKTLDFNIEDPFSMKTIGTDNLSATKTYSLLPNFVGKSIDYAKSYLSSYGIKVNVTEKESTSGTDGQIISQNLPESKRIDLIGSDGITFEVIKLKASDNKPTDDDNDDNNGDSKITFSSSIPNTQNISSTETYVEYSDLANYITVNEDGKDVTDQATFSTSYSDPGITSNTPGTYTVTYKVTYKSVTKEFTKKVIISE